MAIVRWSPLRQMVAMQDQLDRLFHREVGWTPDGFLGGAWSPVLDIFDRDNEVAVKAELPGLTEDDIGVTIEDDVLTIKGEKKHEEKVEEENYYRMECSYGSFERKVKLSATVDAGKTGASYSEGVLEVVLPKTEAAAPKKIEIKSKKK